MHFCTLNKNVMHCVTDYGRPMKPFFNVIPKFWANWAGQPDKFWGIQGILDQTVSPHIGAVSPLSMINIIQLFFSTKNFAFSDLIQMYPKCDIGGSQLLDLIISELKRHTTFLYFNTSHWLNLQHSDWRANVIKDVF